MLNRGQFTFYRSFWEAVKALPKKDRLPILEAIISYALDGADPQNISQRHITVFFGLKPTIDRDIRESKEGRRCSEYKLWRSTVFERDNYTCQICNCRGTRLNAHHIKNYAHYPELRYDVSNGVTLCEACHKLVHKIKRGELHLGLD